MSKHEEQNQEQSAELSDDSLEDVSGGFSYWGAPTLPRKLPPTIQPSPSPPIVVQNPGDLIAGAAETDS